MSVEHALGLLPTGIAVLVNAALGFAGAYALGFVAARAAPSAALRKWIWAAPLLKVVWELGRGASAPASVASTLAGQRWELGHFGLDLGLRSRLLLLRLSARLWVRHGQGWFPLSVGDWATHALRQSTLYWSVLAGVGAVLAVGVLRVALRLQAWRQSFLVERRAQGSARSLGERSVPARRVRLLEGDGQSGPHTCGVFRPVIWLPPELGSVPAAQREAVIEHELSHIRHWDVPLFGFVTLMGDAFWFLPGLAKLQRRLRAAAEEAADDGAIRRGVAPAELARAILAAGERYLPNAAQAVRMPDAALGAESVFARVRRLLSTAKLGRGPLFRTRLVMATYLLGCVLASHFFSYP
ncbi:MAG: M56 family metallopeptidase [Polyangiaceae bacterium]